MPRRPASYSRITVRKRGRWYSLDIRHEGKRWWEATGTDKRSEADRCAERRRLELGSAASHDASPQEAYCLSQAVGDFNASVSGIAEGTRGMYRTKGGHIVRLLGLVDVASLCAADVDGYIATRREEGASDHTISKELVTLRRVLASAERRGLATGKWTGAMPLKFRTGYSPRDRWLTEEEVHRLLAVLPEHRRIWLIAAIYTGGRDSELSAIMWFDVDLKLGFINLRSAKARFGAEKKPRHIPLAPDLRRALEAVPEDKRKGAVLPKWASAANSIAKHAQSAGIVRAATYEEISGTGVHKNRKVRGKMIDPGERLSPNDLRRTFASWMLQHGATVKEVADLLGHGSTAMVERVYGHLAKKNLVDAVRRLPSLAAPSATGLLPIRSEPVAKVASLVPPHARKSALGH